MKQELSALAGHWNALAGDAKWAVLSDPAAKGGQWDEASFWKTGEEDVRRVLAECARVGADPRRGRALDFGSGVGRLSRALAGQFERVDGVDVSSKMVELARSSAPPNAFFHENRVDDLSLFPAESFDFILSLITLQHMEPRFMLRYLEEFRRVLRPGGVISVQLPAGPRPRFSQRRLRTFLRRAAFRLPGAKAAWRAARGELPIEMYGLEQRQVERTLRALGFTLHLAAEDEAAGEDWYSLHYVAMC